MLKDVKRVIYESLKDSYYDVINSMDTKKGEKEALDFCDTLIKLEDAFFNENELGLCFYCDNLCKDILFKGLKI